MSAVGAPPAATLPPRRRATTPALPLRTWAASIALFVLAAVAWEAVARAGIFPAKLFPTLEAIGSALVRITANGTLLASVVATLYRLAMGFLLAAAVGVTLGLLMGRHPWAEDLLLPVVSFMYPIPGIAYAPLFVLWFGLGDVPAILLVGVASCFTVIINTWRGVKGVKPIWVRSATVMGAGDAAMFLKVVLPAALPSVLSGLRLGLAGAWRILIAVEMLMSVDRGLGWLIFGSQQFLNTDVMLATIAVIGVIGVLLEKQLFERLERRTVVRWGMIKA
ncbi:Putative aliphatic sulfonates transport permease protein SsuC [Variovorax sp. PBL-H6]|uniref:ABC transporter permease n=1 Tax=Variovorax sp. PBL-H6 TaxID=434009 RepID=UPI001316DA39|nr:ABC transporter permease [Variovorax sp. PBL-H6]VTU16245.1 Putative aliphatic sulfonates transport permease protein SsuC [Variovorax sp. PBL-H6]